MIVAVALSFAKHPEKLDTVDELRKVVKVLADEVRRLQGELKEYQDG